MLNFKTRIIIGLIISVIWVVFILDNFTYYSVISNSMSPTLNRGDILIVNKNSSIKKYDIVTFQFPFNDSSNKITNQNQKIFVKRCVGIPGELVEIRNGVFLNHGLNNHIIDNVRNLNLCNRDSTFRNKSKHIYGNTVSNKQIIKDFGPSLIPEIGKSVLLSYDNYNLYKYYIEYEVNTELIMVDSIYFFLKGIKIREYIFSKNYFFFCGDNFSNSYDSRYWGFVPEEFIVGRVLYTF